MTLYLLFAAISGLLAVATASCTVDSCLEAFVYSPSRASAFYSAYTSIPVQTYESISTFASPCLPSSSKRSSACSSVCPLTITACNPGGPQPTFSLQAVGSPTDGQYCALSFLNTYEDYTSFVNGTDFAFSYTFNNNLPSSKSPAVKSQLSTAMTLEITSRSILRRRSRSKARWNLFVI
jgi:hypothetical protein